MEAADEYITDFLKLVCDKKLSPDKIYNIDETGFSGIVFQGICKLARKPRTGLLYHYISLHHAFWNHKRGRIFGKYRK